MSVVKINAITAIEGKEAELEARFGDRTRSVEQVEGFESFQLLRPVKGETRYFVCTRWRSEEDFQRWVKSDAFRRGHANPSDGGPVASHASLLSFEVVEWPAEDASDKTA